MLTKSDMSLFVRRSLVAGVLPLAMASLGAGCASPDDDSVGVGTDDLRALNDAEIVGTLAYGESRDLQSKEGPGYVAAAVDVKLGDSLELSVSRQGKTVDDVYVYLTRKSGEVLEGPKLGKLDVPDLMSIEASETLYVVMRHKALVASSFTLRVDGTHAPTASFLPPWATDIKAPVTFECSSNQGAVFVVSGDLSLRKPYHPWEGLRTGWTAKAFEDEDIFEVEEAYRELHDATRVLSGWGGEPKWRVDGTTAKASGRDSNEVDTVTVQVGKADVRIDLRAMNPHWSMTYDKPQGTLLTVDCSATIPKGQYPSVNNGN